jgi:sodium/potassium-transporting ATPase subunit alpha
MMVTGDHHLTAVSIATMVNIIRSNKTIKYFDDVKMKIEGNPKYELHNRNTVCRCKKLSIIEMIKNKILPRGPTLIAKKFMVDGAVVIQGKDILSMDDDHWDYVLSHNEIVFARTTPQNKLLIVSQLQRRGEIVTVTGDGVNDAPALKKADIGIAMGISGTEISKEAAQVIIIDDNFATIVKGIHQGRLLFDNLKKVIAYLLPAGCFSEILPVLAYIFIGLPLPLTTLQMIAICLGTDIIGSMGMVYEYQESDLMKRKPRNAAVDHLISFSAVMKIYFQTGLIQSTIAFFMYFYTMHQSGIDTSQLLFAYEKWDANEIFAGVDLDTRKDALSFAQTGYFVALVMTQIINLFTVRTRYQSFFKQKFRSSLIFIALGEIAIVVFLCFTAPLRPYLETHIAAWYHFVFPLLMGLSIFFVDEFKKLMIRKYPNTFLAKLVW